MTDIWTCEIYGKIFPITIKSHLVYEENNDNPVNVICDCCDILVFGEGPR